MTADLRTHKNGVRRAVPMICLLLCSLLLLPGCTDNGGTDGISVVTSFYPVYVFTLNLTEGINGIEVTNLTEQNVGCLHDYRLLTRDVKLLSDCDLFVLCGAGAESFLDDLLTQLPHIKTVDSSIGADFLFADAGISSHMKEANTHIWLSVKNAIIQVNNICDALKALCPQYSQELKANCAEYTGRLEELYSELLLSAKPLAGEKIITFHEAYDYMAKELSLDVVASIESEEGGEPSARKLGELTELINARGINALYTEPNYSGSAAKILSAETGVPVYVLNPVTGGEGKLTDYEDIMKQNLAVLTEAANRKGIVE